MPPRPRLRLASLDAEAIVLALRPGLARTGMRSVIARDRVLLRFYAALDVSAVALAEATWGDVIQEAGQVLIKLRPMRGSGVKICRLSEGLASPLDEWRIWLTAVIGRELKGSEPILPALGQCSPRSLALRPMTPASLRKTIRNRMLSVGLDPGYARLRGSVGVDGSRLSIRCPAKRVRATNAR